MIFVTNRPFNKPKATPTPIATTTAIGTGTPLVIRAPAIIPPSPTTDPTDKSIPPLMINMVIHKEINETCESFLSIFTTFILDMKLGLIIVVMMHKTISMIAIPILSLCMILSSLFFAFCPIFYLHFSLCLDVYMAFKNFSLLSEKAV